MTGGSYSIKLYADCGDGKYINCFSQERINSAQIYKLFKSINKELSAERKKLTDENKWTAFTMIIDAKGNIRADFDYTNFDENAISYEEEWEKNICKIIGDING